MENYIDEKTVMLFYLGQMRKDKINFLKKQPKLKANITELFEKLIYEDKMNTKIQLASQLWKKLFEASMMYLSPNKKGYDKIFQYFDAYVEFEELIFASDSFYRDHTLHCLWVYLLGEYIRRNKAFDPLFVEEKQIQNTERMMSDVWRELGTFDEEEINKIDRASRIDGKMIEYDESIRCVAALTHDLGYPLKKIEKINKSIKKVIPYFAINDFDDFSFEYGNIQQGFVNEFIDFISRNYTNAINVDDEEVGKLLFSAFNISKSGVIISYDKEKIQAFTRKQREDIKAKLKVEVTFQSSYAKKAAFYNDFENYQHGIMSAFLLSKNLRAFQDFDYNKTQDQIGTYAVKTIAMQTILTSISNHTCDSYQISALNQNSFLTFVDELEEFSRISRASQNREYVEEFCDTSICMNKDWLDISFDFNNTNLANLNPEISFKGRCKRFLSLFDIPRLSKTLKIRVTVIDNLQTNKNTYVLEIANKYADIRINGESVSIPDYLKTSQFYTKEEYEAM